MSLTTVLYIVLAAVIAFVAAFFQYGYKTSKHTGTFILPVLRFLAVFSLLLLLLNPKVTSRQYQNLRPTLNIIADNSASIEYAKQGDQVQGLINRIAKNTNLNKKFDIQYYSFSDGLHPLDSLTFNKPETNIVKTLKTVNQLYKNKVAPVILITDGNQTYGSNYEFYTSNQQVYTVAVGDTLRYDDIKISRINVNAYTNLNNKFPVEVFVQYDGDKPVQKTLTIRQKNTLLFQKQFRFSAQQNSRKIQFYLPANSVGIHHYTCAITTLDNEKNTVNNRKPFIVEVLDEQAKILVLSTINHPDIGMIKRSIETHKQRKVVIEKELNKDIQFKDYQLVILYQPTSKFDKVFKKLKENTTNYFIITGTKTDWKFLNNAQAVFSKKNISTYENYSAALNTGYDEYLVEDIGFSKLPPLEDYFGDISFSVPHKILLYQKIANFNTQNPLLATFTMKARRGAVLFGENSWKWRMLTKVENRSFEKFDTFFNKLIQYLSSEKRASQLEIRYNPFVYANGTMVIDAQFFDATYAFDNTENLQLIVSNSETKETKKLPFALKNNSYQAVLSNLKPGTYNFRVLAKNHQISKSGRFTVLTYGIERQFTTTNTASLKKIAMASQGNFAHIHQADKLLATLLSDKRYATVQKSIKKRVSLIDWKWLLAWVILLFSVEWFIRKYKGLI